MTNFEQNNKTVEPLRLGGRLNKVCCAFNTKYRSTGSEIRLGKIAVQFDGNWLLSQKSVFTNGR